MRRGACSREKAVLVTVFVERPRRRTRVSSNHNHQHRHQPQLHHPITQALIHPNGGGGKGYDRKAELLRYSHGLRQSARPASSTPRPIAPHNSQPTTKIILVEEKPRYSRVPTCLDIWKNLIPNFMKSSKGKEKNKSKNKQRGSTTSKMNTMMKSLKAQKKGGFFSKLASTLQKRK